MYRPSRLCISRQNNKARTLTSSLCLTLIKSRGLIPTRSWHLDNPLSRNKRGEVQKFVDKHLKKGYIRPSKSEQTLPVFFVEKKDGGKHMVMDYCKLNRQTIKNNYPLPLITELVDNMGSKRVFTKMDLQWGYNNVRIKEGDE